MRAVGADLVLVDTSAWIAAFARSGFPQLKTALERFLDEDRVATAGAIVLELLQGCRSIQERDQLEWKLRALHWLAANDDHWFIAGKTAFSLRRSGVTVGAVDALIATVAESYDVVLLHRDSDFDLIARHTRLRVLPVG